MTPREKGLASIEAMKSRGTWTGLWPLSCKKYKRKPKPKKIRIYDVFVRESYKLVSVKAKYTLRDYGMEMADLLALSPLDEIIEAEENSIYDTNS